MASFLDDAGQGHRLRILMGMTQDLYCTSSTLRYKLEALLLLQLRQRGYRRVVFYSASKKLHWLDAETARLIDSSIKSVNATTGARMNTSSIRPGPTKPLRRNLQNTSPTPVAPVTDSNHHRWDYGAMSDSRAASDALRLLKDRDIPTALVVRDTVDLLSHFDSDAIRIMNELFGYLQQADGAGLGILIFPHYLTTEQLDRNNDRWSHLVSSMLNKKGGLDSKVFFVGTPDETEIAHAMAGEHLKRCESFDAATLKEPAKHLARQARFDYAQSNSRAGTVGGLSQLLKQEFKEKGLSQASAWERLQAMTGMEPVVTTLRGMIKVAKRQQRQSALSDTETANDSDIRRLSPRLPAPETGDNLHLALMGSPGTGKTTVATLIAEIFREEGLLETGHLVKRTRKDLVAGYVGQTAIQTGAAVDLALGGVLFIDEAYRLSEDSGEHNWGKEAIETVMEAMSAHNGHFSVIIAGYPQKILDFIEGSQANEGLPGRFPKSNRITIDDFTPVQLQMIFQGEVTRRGLQLHEELISILPDFIAKYRTIEKFSNARAMISLASDMERNNLTRDNASEVLILTREDVPKDLRRYLPGQADTPAVDPMHKLDALVGLHPVKQQLRSLAALLRMDRLRDPSSRPDPGHYLFLGNPGTGKTMVANILGEILREQGLLVRGHVVPGERKNLVAGYSGQTALQTEATLKEALDGILFIDEAYQLINGENDSFGQEALGNLLTFMENNRNRLTVVAAGYPEVMQHFVNSNPGLPSRFKYTIIFPDYTAQEMMEILEQMMSEKKVALTPDAKEQTMKIFLSWKIKPIAGWENARGVRNLLDKLRENQALRLVAIANPNYVELTNIEVMDVPEYIMPVQTDR
jgi:SpoVK/Ycf46/Vps4 family AAA+-type ATPase